MILNCQILSHIAQNCQVLPNIVQYGPILPSITRYCPVIFKWMFQVSKYLILPWSIILLRYCYKLKRFYLILLCIYWYCQVLYDILEYQPILLCTVTFSPFFQNFQIFLDFYKWSQLLLNVYSNIQMSKYYLYPVFIDLVMVFQFTRVKVKLTFVHKAVFCHILN